MAKVKYVGGYDAVEVPFDGQWITFPHGVEVDVPDVLVHGEDRAVEVDGELVVSRSAGLADQADIWQVVAAKKSPAAVPAADEE